MKAINLKFKEKQKTCSILITNNYYPQIFRLLKKEKPSSCAIICDSETDILFGKDLQQRLIANGFRAELFSFPSGELSKNLAAAEALTNEMLSAGIDRKSLAIALGGGVVGDLAGFVSACYMRGIPYIQIPTTLLAMVDSSIGGKTGVDVRFGKNSFGAFHQPEAIYIDVTFLGSLPEKEIKNGLAECIKYGVTSDKDLFAFIEKSLEKLVGKDKEALEHVVMACSSIKGKIVMKDEREENLRKILNFGHTIGHAIEALTEYNKYAHGEAIAAGMYHELLLAERFCGFPHGDTERIKALLEKAGFALSLPELCKAKDLVEYMRKDKKNISGRIAFSLPASIGRMHSNKGDYAVYISEEEIRKVLDR